MSSRIRTFLTALLTLLTAALLAFAPVAAKPASGGYQLFEPAALADQHAIHLAALENFDYYAKIAPECCNATKGGELVGGSYVPGGGSIVKDGTVRLEQNIFTKTGETIPAGSVVTENGGAIKVVPPNGTSVTGKTSDLLGSNQLALPGAKSPTLKVTASNPSASERAAAEHMADLGRDVELRDPVGTRAGGQTSDLLVDGVPYDVYTPTSASPNRIISAIAKKNNQATRIVVDLSNSSVTADQLGNILSRVNGAGATNITDIVIIGK